MQCQAPNESAGSPRPARVAITRAPGGLPGIEAHAGASLALAEWGLYGLATHVYGASAGALVSALQAAGHTAESIAELARGYRTRDLIAKRGLLLRPFLSGYSIDPRRIERELEQLLPGTFGELSLPLTVSAVRMLTGAAARGHRLGYCAVSFGRESEVLLRDAVLASMSIAGFFPYREVRSLAGGVRGRYTDGATLDAIVEPACIADTDLLVVVDLYRGGGYAKRDANRVSRLLWNAEALAAAERIATRRRLSARPNVLYLDIDMGRETPMLEFSPDHGLIDSARRQAREQITEAFNAPGGRLDGCLRRILRKAPPD